MHHEDPETAAGETSPEAEQSSEAASEAAAETATDQAIDQAIETPTEPAYEEPVPQPRPMGWLIGLQGDLEGRMFVLAPGTTTLGSSPRADVIIDDLAVSRLHCLVIDVADGQQLEDLGSTNGTYINNRRVTSEPLKDLDWVRLGRCEFIYRSSSYCGFHVQDPHRPPASTGSSRQTMVLPPGLSRIRQPAKRFRLAWITLGTAATPDEIVRLDCDRFVIGSAETANLILPGLDGEHIELCKSDDGYTFRALSSETAMWMVNGTYKHECPLNDGDVVHFGSNFFMFQEIWGRGISYGEPVVSGWLIGENPPLHGMVFPLTERLVIGSTAECDLTIEDPLVSRRHCEIIPTPTGFMLRDLGSTNGTKINDLRMFRHDLQDGDELRIGHARLRYKGISQVRPISEPPISEPESARTPFEPFPSSDPPVEEFAMAWLVPIEDNCASSPILVANKGMESDELEKLTGYEFICEDSTWRVRTVEDAAPFVHQGASTTEAVLADEDLLQIDGNEYVFKCHQATANKPAAIPDLEMPVIPPLPELA